MASINRWMVVFERPQTSLGSHDEKKASGGSVKFGLGEWDHLRFATRLIRR
jgi:hypothetical protein